ncbi:MAG: hypothetical protein HKN51_02645, partial [Saprospiraceae bacterium]|nr:hypothetical protein [Saprospiraceae bacterium]
MRKLILSLIIISAMFASANAQIIPTKFGKGIQFLGKDSSYHIKAAFRFQSLYSGEWRLQDGSFNDYQGNIFTRRSRIKIDGWAVSPKLKYKFELALSNRDLNGGQGPEFRSTANMVLDAYVRYWFHKNFAIQFG